MDLKILQAEVYKWAHYNFPTNRKPHKSLLGVMEELGELAHAQLKEEQNIRINENHIENAKDAIGDIIIFLADYCGDKNFDLDKIITDVWSEVKKRDWIKYPVNGVSE